VLRGRELSGQPDLTAAQGDVLLQIRNLTNALADGDGAGYGMLLRLLHATLNVRRLTVEIRRGSFVHNLAKLNRSQRNQLLNFAERWGASDIEMRRIVKSLTLPGEDGPSNGVTAAITRLEYRREIANEGIRKVPLVAVGAHCLAWTLPNRWGLRPAADIPHLFNMLSLAAHRPGFVAQEIENNFADYLDPDKLKTITSTNGYNMVARSDGGALWNHCIGPYWTESNFRRFRKIMTTHVERFREEWVSDAYSLRVFLLHLPSALSDEQALAQAQHVAIALHGKVRGRHALLAIDTSKRDQSPTMVKSVDPTVSIIRAPVPPGNYQWPMAESYNSSQGLTYERSIAEAIGETVAGWTGNEKPAER
jgi:hypothetical protein